MDFETMIATARSILFEVHDHPATIPQPQVTLVYTANGNLYTTVNDIRGEIAATLRSEQDTLVLRLVTLWQDGTLDVPSWNFRKALLDLNPQNAGAEILLQGQDAPHVKRIKDTLPPV